jgi:hypothetical protein
LEGPPAREVTAGLEHLAHGLNPAQGATPSPA